MDVLYTCDNNYVWLMGISTISLFECNKSMDSLSVYLLGESISKENKEILDEIAKKYGRRITVIDVPKIDIPESLVSARWPLSAFTRLYSGQLLPEKLKKVLYLDCDTIISGSISELDELDVSEKIVYGVKDCIGSSYKKNIGLKPNAIYVNAGVLLFNLERLRKVDINNVVAQYMRQYEKLINYADQDVLNGILKGEIGVLNPRYDVMTIDVEHTYKEISILRRPTNFYAEQELKNAVNNPVIIHYTTNMRVVRPWFINANHPLTENFRKYLSLSPWKNIELREMKFTANEARVIGMIMKLPKPIAYRVLGFIHSEAKPLYIKLRANRRK